MKARLPFVVGAAVGYVLGTKAGRERYEQIRKAAGRFAENPRVQETAGVVRTRAEELASTAKDRAGGLAETAKEKVDSAKDKVGASKEKMGTNVPGDHEKPHGDAVTPPREVPYQ